MDAAIPIALSDEESLSEKTSLLMVDAWLGAVERFRAWERAEVYKKEPSPETLAEHRRASTWLIRMTRMLQLCAKDPDFPAPQVLGEVEGKLLQLESAWDTFHNPMSDEEADAILAKAFPDAPGVGSPR